MTSLRLVGSMGLVKKSKGAQPHRLDEPGRSSRNAVVTIVVTSTRRCETSRINSMPPHPGHPEIGDQDAIVGRGQGSQRLLGVGHRIHAQVFGLEELPKLG